MKTTFEEFEDKNKKVDMSESNLNERENNLNMFQILVDEAKNNIKAMKEMQLEMRKSEQKVMKVGEFLVDFYNEYREHDGLTMAMTKELKEAQHEITSTITKILNPRLEESRKRGDTYLVEWIKVNKGIWSIYKTNVNGVSVPYDRTPKIKYTQALKYMKSLTVGDYLAYRDERWGDIRKFEFVEVAGEEKMTIDKIVNVVSDKVIKANDDGENDGGAPVMIH